MPKATSDHSKKRGSTVSAAYENDFYSWAFHRSRLLREGRLAEAGRTNIAEELAGLGRSEYRQLRSALARIIQHLLKWGSQPAKRTGSWQREQKPPSGLRFS